jgi:hypothetical protein
VSTPDAVIAGRYRLVNRIAAGGMGTVWQGWDERLRRPVAIKQLHPQPGLSGAAADMVNDRAMREARITARLHHPHAITVFDVVEQDGQPCLIMQYLPSTSLQAILNDRGTLAPIEVARIGAEIASALAAAHQAGIVHRDVKPGNVLIAEDGAANITDFGISHALGDVTLTSTGMVTGTPAYLAPEVARGSESTFAADVFSLGATLYAAVEGAPPFGTDENPMAVLHKVASGQVIPPHRAGPLGPLLTRMLAADPAGRPAMIDVARTLSALHSDAVTAPTVARTKPLIAPISGAVGGAAADPTVPVRPAAGTDAADDRTRRVAPVAGAGVAGAGLAGAGLAGLGLAGPGPAGSGPAGSGPAGSGPAGSGTAGSGSGVPPRTGGGGRAAVLEPADEPERGHRGMLAAAIAVVSVLLIVGLAYATGLIGGGSGGSGGNDTPLAGTPNTSTSKSAASTRPTSAPASATQSSSAPTSATQSSSPHTSASQSSNPPTSATQSGSAPTSAAQSTGAQSSGAPSNAGGGATPTAGQLAAAIRGYYALLPENTDGGWARLSAAYQSDHAGGRANYDNFWRDIDKVSVSNVVGLPPNTVEADVTYTAKSGGRVTQERTRFELISEGGVLKIDTSTVLTSQGG